MDARFKLKLETFKEIAEKISLLSTSPRLKVGCIIVKKDFSAIDALGYNGNLPKTPLNEWGTEEDSIEIGKDGFIHAEINALLKFRKENTKDYMIIVTHSPCKQCTKCIINAGFDTVYFINEYRELSHLKLFEEYGCKIEKI